MGKIRYEQKVLGEDGRYVEGALPWWMRLACRVTGTEVRWISPHLDARSLPMTASSQDEMARLMADHRERLARQWMVPSAGAPVMDDLTRHLRACTARELDALLARVLKSEEFAVATALVSRKTPAAPGRPAGVKMHRAHLIYFVTEE